LPTASHNTIPIHKSLISVSDKTDLDKLAIELTSAGIEILSTGGTREYLEARKIPVGDVAIYTGFPEMLDGRLKTLHPKIFGGILARHDKPQDVKSLREHSISLLPLVIVNLYPFEKTIEREGVSNDEAIEQIDIGGPSLVRAAAKNHAFTAIVTSPTQYEDIIREIREFGGTTYGTRRRLAAEAFARTAEYDVAIANFFDPEAKSAFPELRSSRYRRQSLLRYGENPHQRAALYRSLPPRRGTLVSATQRHGKELSYNNYLDLDAALRIVRNLPMPAVSAVKHNNPCGVAFAKDLRCAAEKAMAGDPESAFGAILGCNRTLDVGTAEVLARPNQFIEAIIAPEIAPDAFEWLTTRPKWKSNVRLMEIGHFVTSGMALPGGHRTEVPLFSIREIDGGLLVQDSDHQREATGDWKIVTTSAPSDEELSELAFAWHVVRFVRSNAITVTRDGMLLGAGAGQMSRVDAVRLALAKAGERAQGAVLASDAFFPFPDSVELAAAAGIRSIVQPGGSRNDSDVISACETHGLSMVFTSRRHFLH
jgi:phosphoribosylaminoimidazolecarboxamide formyltransferase/IMP cyclohydrolase